MPTLYTYMKLHFISLYMLQHIRFHYIMIPLPHCNYVVRICVILRCVVLCYKVVCNVMCYYTPSYYKTLYDFRLY